MIDKRLIALYEILDEKDREIEQLREQVTRLMTAIRNGDSQMYREFGQVLAATLTQTDMGVNCNDQAGSHHDKL